MNAGREVPMLHSCFVLPLEDDLDSILKTFRNTMMIQKFGGGVGMNFSPLRMQGSHIASTGGHASGPVSFMKMWNTGMDVIKQAGKRQGALMGVLDVNHPDLLDFITQKTIEGTMTNFNISVAIDNAFMQDYLAGATTRYPCELTAKQIMQLISAGIWNNGEPGILFMDTINRDNPYDEPITCVNPCGEIPIPAYGACCLGSINLASCLQRDVSGTWIFEMGELERLTNLGLTFLDNVITHGEFLIPEIREFEDKYRPLGLGVMGLAEVLATLMIPYGSHKAHVMIDDIMNTMSIAAKVWRFTRASRNATLLSIAPTGTLAMLARTSYSIEPYFSLAYTKKVDAGSFHVIEPIVQRVFDIADVKLNAMIKQEFANTGSLVGTDAPEEIKHVLRTAVELTPEEHLSTQEAVQKYVDNSVSKTINMPASTEPDEITKIIVSAWHRGLKGLTMYRSTSREVEVIECASGKCEL
jgi:ribonucleoside-diphosphate reductase alpha chain